MEYKIGWPYPETGEPPTFDWLVDQLYKKKAITLDAKEHVRFTCVNSCVWRFHCNSLAMLIRFDRQFGSLRAVTDDEAVRDTGSRARPTTGSCREP